MRSPLLVAALLLMAGCAPAPDNRMTFTKVDVPATPTKLAVSGSTLLIGATGPKLFGLTGGTLAPIAAQPATPYGELAQWYSITADESQIIAIGGERGGAHGNVRWSAWNGPTRGISEKRQGFSTFGGYGAGDLVDAVLTPSGPVLVGTWQSAKAALDVAVWTLDGETWTRQNSAGTALESTLTSLGFPTSATALEQGILVVGWRLGDGAERPVVWRSTEGPTGWSGALLPDAAAGAALAARCWDSTCLVAGRVDGKLAVWRLTDGAWSRVGGVPDIVVGDELAAPVMAAGKPTLVVPDQNQVKVLRLDGDQWTVRTAAGPSGSVTAATTIDDKLYLLSGPDENSLSLFVTQP